MNSAKEQDTDESKEILKMEQFAPSYDQLEIHADFPGDSTSRVGIFYDPETLLHFSTLNHPERKIPHPESPARLVAIMNHLHRLKLTERVFLKHKLEPASQDTIKLFHQPDYVKLVEDMWLAPGEHLDYTDKHTKYFFDTYHNIHTPLASSLAVGGVTEAVDALFTNKLDRVFACVRPPGHHAAGHEDQPFGFCIYNNVAIAARYAQKQYNAKRIVIFDWDIHHGDSTSKFLYNDASVLYISLHRYDNGEYFPGKIGDMERLGEGEGLGYNLHATWNIPSKKHTLGDDEYIYALERVFAPIIKSFQPDLTIVSAGFDAARGDPLGGLDVTTDGYAYMTRRLLELSGGKIIIALEGGYSLQAISVSAESCVRVLLGEELPLQNTMTQKSFEEARLSCCPNKSGYETVQKALELFRPYWPCLNEDDEAVSFHQLIEKNRNKAHIAGGHEDIIIFKDNKLYKKAKVNEFVFYRSVFGDLEADPRHAASNLKLRELIPKYYGEEEIDSEKHIVLENLIVRMPNCSIIDMKLGRITHSPYASEQKKKEYTEKSARTTSNSLGFRVSGYVIRDDQGNVLKKNTKSGCYYDLDDKSVRDLLKEVLGYSSDKEANEKATEGVLSFLSKLIAWFEQDTGRIFIGSSILLAVDNTKKEYAVSFIDFANVFEQEKEQTDENVLFGLRNMIEIFREIEKERASPH